MSGRECVSVRVCVSESSLCIIDCHTENMGVRGEGGG